MKDFKFPAIKKKLTLRKREEKDPFLDQLASSVNTKPEPAQSGNEGVSYSDLIQEYNALQAEYIQNPTVETNEKLIELHKKMQDNTLAQNNNLVEPERTVEADSDTKNESEPADVEMPTLFVSPSSTAEKHPPEPEDNDEQASFEDREKENADYITKQIEKHQPFVSQKRKDWREKKPVLESTALEKFQQLQDSLVIQKPKQTQNKIFEKNFGRFIKKDEPKDEPRQEPQTAKPATTPDKEPETHDIPSKEPTKNDTPNEEPITAPSDLNPKIKEIWDDLDNESKRRIIEKHKLEKETEQELKKKSIFNKKINFSLKKKELKEVEGIDKKKFSLFHRKPSLKSIEAYCHKCKHELISHAHKGKSAGCKECGCLVTIQKILEVNKITFKTDDDPEEIDNGLVCKCGHNEIIHKLRGFCEEKDCYCVGFQKPSS